MKVPKGIKDKEVKLLIKIPKNAQPGDEWGIITSFRQMNNEGDSPVQINSGITHVFGVMIPKVPETGEVTKAVGETKGIRSISTGPAVLIIIAGILLVVMLVKRKRPKERRK